MFFFVFFLSARLGCEVLSALQEFDPSQSCSMCVAALLNPCEECVLSPLARGPGGFIATFKQISVRRYLCISRRNDHLQILTRISDEPLMQRPTNATATCGWKCVQVLFPLV